MNYNEIIQLTAEQMIELYQDILEGNYSISGCTYGYCGCATKNGYSTCYYSGCGYGSDYGWYYGWAYYTSCNNGVRGYGYWNGGNCNNAVCPQVQ